MSDSDLFSMLIVSTLVVFFLSRQKARKWQLVDQPIKLHSLPGYYGYLTAFFSTLPALVVFVIWSAVETNVIAVMMVAQFSSLQALDPAALGLTINKILLLVESGGAFDASVYAQEASAYLHYVDNSATLKALTISAIVVLGSSLTYWRITPTTKARNSVESLVIYLLFISAAIAILTTVGILFSVLFESISFFSQVHIVDFLFGTHWSPQVVMNTADQSRYANAFGILPLLSGTIFIAVIAMIVAAPLGLLSAIYLSEYASDRVKTVVKPVVEILAGVPTVVYGFFAALTVGPMVRDFGLWIRSIGVDLDIQLMADITVTTESVLAVGLVMGMMIVPFILSISSDVISAVPNAMREGSIALGATKSETIWKVIVPAALPGIVGGFLLAVSRAIGETMIVLMAAGVAANLTANLMDTVTTITTQIVVLLTGDQSFDSVKTLAAFALGLTLFIITLILNVIALHVVKKYREQYE